jgi:WD40 repeat protein
LIFFFDFFALEEEKGLDVFYLPWSQITSVVDAVAFDGRTIVSGPADDTIKAWDAATGACVRSLEGHSDEVSAVAFDGWRAWLFVRSTCTPVVEVSLAKGIAARAAISDKR